MKKNLLLIVLGLMIAFSAFSATKNEAEENYAKRGEDVNFAQTAADMYEELYNNATDVMEKGYYAYRHLESTYYVGTNIGSENVDDRYWPIERKEDGFGTVPKSVKKVRVPIHMNGYKMPKRIISSLKKIEKSVERNKLLAKIYFFQAAHLGKWGDNKGITVALPKLRTLKKITKKIINLSQDGTELHGADRILGRIEYKTLGMAGGSLIDSEQHLEKAYKNSLNDEGVCMQGVNVLYYAETLIDLRKKDEAKAILNKFLEGDAETLNLGRIPETRVEMEYARKLLELL